MFRIKQKMPNEPVKTGLIRLILAHGAGAGMHSEFMQKMSKLLKDKGIIVYLFDFPYMQKMQAENRRLPPNTMAQLQQAYRDEIVKLRTCFNDPIFIAGKSMGGRVASMIADEQKVAGCICLGYPFYPAKQYEKTRTSHLLGLETATLIIQGERDALGDKERVCQYKLSSAIELLWLAAADHDLKPLKRSGYTHCAYLSQAAEAVFQFIQRQLDNQNSKNSH